MNWVNLVECTGCFKLRHRSEGSAYSLYFGGGRGKDRAM